MWKSFKVGILRMLREDLYRAYSYTTGGKFNRVIECLRTPGVHAIVVYRFGRWLLNKSLWVRALLTPLYMFFSYRTKTKWGIEIPRHTQIGAGFYIGHFGGITISSAAKLGQNINISQGVTIGVSGQGEKFGAPMIGDNVYIAPGAKIFGKIAIGDNVKIGANAIIYKDIPENAIVVLDPGYKIISYKGNF